MRVTCGAVVCVLSVLSLSAFGYDWKAKPTVEVKADLVAYVEKIAVKVPAEQATLKGFAARIADEKDTTAWMAESIDFGNSLLRKCEGSDYRDPLREIGLRIIDFPLHVENFSEKMANEAEIAAFNEAVLGYVKSARERVFAEVKSAKVPAGQLRAWRLYNMGFILKTAKHTVAIDIPERPTLVTWKQAPGAKFRSPVFLPVWSDEDRRQLAALCDMFILTHPHGDHYAEGIVREFMNQKKPLVLPCDLVKFDIKGLKPGSPARRIPYTTTPECIKLEKDNAEPVDVKGVKIRNFIGNQGAGTPCNVYVLDIDGVVVAHNGDNYDRGKEAQIAKCPPADLVIGSTWNNIQSFVGNAMKAPGFDPVHSVFVPAHENELGHSVDHRESYREMYTRKDRLGNDDFKWPRVLPLGWGESVTVGAKVK